MPAGTKVLAGTSNIKDFSGSIKSRWAETNRLVSTVAGYVSIM